MTLPRMDQKPIPDDDPSASETAAKGRRKEILLKAGALQNTIFKSADFLSIATDEWGIIQIFNIGAERMLGYTAAEVVHKFTPADLSDPQEVLARAKALSQELGTPIAPGFAVLTFKASRVIEDSYEWTYLRKDSSPFPVVVSVTASRDEQGEIAGYLLIGTDNSVRKQSEEALLKAGALQASIFNSANFTSIATDEKGIIQIFSASAERMLGYPAAAVINKASAADIGDPGELAARASALSAELGISVAPGFQSLVIKASHGIEDLYELSYIRKDGRRVPTMVSVTALRDLDARIVGYLFIGTDHTARKLVEAEQEKLNQRLREANVELERAKSAAEKANLAKSEFLSSMSHELRSPLNAILGFAQLMESALPPPTPFQAESIAQILQAGWHLLNLINEILDLAVIESGKVSLSLEPVSLAEVLSECQAMMDPLARQRGIRMQFPRWDSPLFVHADRTRLKQIVINLLSNAIKYNKEQGAVVVACVAGTSERIRISIKDTGAGLPPEKLSQLFQPFNRLGQEAGGVAGTGIGLFVTRRLAELMGGFVGAESNVGEGSVFWCELIAAAAPQMLSKRGEAEILIQTPLAEGTPRQTILYVEDNPANMKLVEQLISRRSDLHLLCADNGTLGIELARTARPVVILMDINLPGLSGIDCLRILQEDPATARIPIVALSANAMPRDIERGMKAGFFRYLTKPIKVKEFMDTLNEAIEFAERPDGK